LGEGERERGKYWEGKSECGKSEGLRGGKGKEERH
jgi:hypothetical protein